MALSRHSTRDKRYLAGQVHSLAKRSRMHEYYVAVAINQAGVFCNNIMSQVITGRSAGWSIGLLVVGHKHAGLLTNGEWLIGGILNGIH